MIKFIKNVVSWIWRKWIDGSLAKDRRRPALGRSSALDLLSGGLGVYPNSANWGLSVAEAGDDSDPYIRHASIAERVWNGQN